MSGVEAPLKAADTHGILLRSEHRILKSSDDLGWTSLYASHQIESPYRARFEQRDYHLVIVHLSGPVSVERELSGENLRTRVTTGGLFVLPANREFGVALHGPLETVHLYVRKELLRLAASELTVGDPERLEFLPRLGEHDPVLEHLGRMVCSMMSDRQTDFFADGAARLIAAQLVRSHSCRMPAPVPRATGLSPRQMEAVQDLIEERMDTTLGIDDLASAAGLSPIHFARQFKRTTGKAPYQYLIEARLTRARTLLAGRLPIAEIALCCGFSHQEHLTRLFGRQFGVTPAAYRRGVH